MGKCTPGAINGQLENYSVQKQLDVAKLLGEEGREQLLMPKKPAALCIWE